MTSKPIQQALVLAEKRNVSMAPFTTWRVGGLAQRFFMPTCLDELSLYLSQLELDVPCTLIGLGSNVLVRDGGISGRVICTKKLQEMKLLDSQTIYVQAGVTCAKFARFCTALGFEQAAFFAGIPGTMGGALAMNAGAFGSETWPWVKSVEIMNRLGNSELKEANEYDVGYRSVKRKSAEQNGDIFVAGLFQFSTNRTGHALTIKELLRKRNASQPIGTFNCGSVFRNPPGDYAARLIEACGLKGYQIGQAVISTKHANFIINQAKASSEDIEALMECAQQQVFQRFGIQLVTEVRILGENRKE